MMQSGAWHRVCGRCHATFLGPEEFCPHDGTPLAATPNSGAAGGMLGQVLDGRFTLQKVLGQGGMGIVYLARHTVLDRLFALKLLRRELLGDPLVLRRFQREARTASSVVHPNIVHIYDFGQTRDGQAFLVMEYVNGISLYAFCESFPSRQLHVSQAVDITMQVTQALAAAHAYGIVHRDIKPDNLAQEAGRHAARPQLRLLPWLAAADGSAPERGGDAGQAQPGWPDRSRGEVSSHRF